MPDPDPQLLASVRRDLRVERDRRQQAIADLAVTGAKLAGLDLEIGARGNVGDIQGVQAFAAQRAALAGQRAGAARLVEASDATLRDVIGRLHLAIDPCDADPALPLLLLPVRLETRFSADQTSLRVRVFPDDIHIDQLDRGVADDERAAAIAYWTAVWRADDGAAGSAWRALVAAVGRSRASWAAIATRPTNLAARQAEPAPVFPATTGRTKRAAVARLLPDRFVAVAIQAGRRSTATGNPVAPETVIGLFADDGSELRDVAGLKLTAGAEWLADYAEAERIGMALTLPLAQPGRVDQLFVVGVRASADPAAVAAEFDALLQAQSCTRGLAFVPQGTPTNNTETDRAAWQNRVELIPPPRDPLVLAADANATVLAAALGIRAETLAPLDHAAHREQGLARSMNTALWGATWETFLDKVNVVNRDGATLSDTLREQARRFSRDTVRGRGPLPTLRVGNQPYGILPVSSVAGHWQPNPGDGFEKGLLDLLRRLRGKWLSCLDAVQRVGVGSLDTVLPEILGSSPVSIALRVRSVLSDDFAQSAASITGSATTGLDLERLIDELLMEELILNASLMRRTGSLSVDSRPLALPLTDPAHDADALEAIAAGGSPKVSSVFQALVSLAWDRAARQVTQASASGKLGDILNLAGTALPAQSRDRVLALAERGTAVGAETFFAEARRVGVGIAATPSLSELQPVPALRRSFGELTLTATTDTARSQLGALATMSWLNASGRLAELRAALVDIVAAIRAGDDSGQVRIAVAETLDCASHRLDAWLTGLVERRRQSQRISQPAGLQVGAFGWVEGIEPGSGAPADGGFVAAPSMAHAATAGILRSAYLAHNADAAGSSAFAIDLSSSRVRAAMKLIGGIRSGQGLSSLLGYRLERRLHEARLDRLILTLRTIAPLTQGRLTDRAINVEVAAIEKLAAGNVTDGLQLVEKYQGKIVNWDAGRIRARLTEKPIDNPYLTGPWPVLTDAEWGMVVAAIEATVAEMDAVADLLMAESVHQMAQGNMPRAAAALDGGGTGDVPPPEPDVVSTRREEVPFTHRVLLVAMEVADTAGWSASQPRAAASPALEAWAVSRLGPAADVAIAGDGAGGIFTAAQAGLCALDLLYGAQDRAGWERRLRRALPALPAATPLFDAPQPGWPAGRRAIGDVVHLAQALRRLLAGARPAVAADLALPSTPPVRAVSPAGIGIAHQRLVDAAATLSVRRQMLDAALAAFPVDPAALAGGLDRLADFGVSIPGVSITDVAEERIQGLAQVALAEAARRLALTEPALADTPTAEAIVAIGQMLFGDGFWVTPAIDPPAAADAWSAALGGGPEVITAGASDIRRYLTDVSSVRDGVRRLSEVILLAEATGQKPNLRVAQMAGPGRDRPTRWIGGRLDPTQPTTTTAVTSIVVDAPDGYDPMTGSVALVLDQWTETMPLLERRGTAADAPIDSRVTAGVALNAHAARSRAPQAMLLAVAPDASRWTTNALIDVLAETLDLARLRLVTLEYTNGIGRVLPALYAQSWSLQGEKVLDLRFVAERAFAASAVASYVKDSGA